MARYFLIAICLIIYPCISYAYVDPGTGGLLYQILYALFYGLLASFFMFFSRLKNAVQRLFRRAKTSGSENKDTDR